MSSIISLITDKEKIKELNGTDEQEIINMSNWRKVVDTLKYSSKTQEHIEAALEAEYKITLTNNEEYIFNKENNFRMYAEITDSTFLETEFKRAYGDMCGVPDTIKSLVGSNLLVISKNPVDFMMCSTNQPFKSCYAMDSTYSYAYGVPAFFANKPIFLTFLTKRKRKNYSMGGAFDKNIKHFEMRSRYFSYMVKQDGVEKLAIGNIYPKDGAASVCNSDGWRSTNLRLLESIEVPIVKCYDNYLKLTGNCIDISTDKFKANPYLDDLILDSETNEGTYEDSKFYLKEGSRGNRNWVDIEGCTVQTLVQQGKSIDSWTGGEDEDDDDDRCYCAYCHEYYCDDDVIWINNEGFYLCESCLNDSDYSMYDMCGNYYLYDNMSGVDDNDYSYCDNCLDRGLENNSLLECDNSYFRNPWIVNTQTCMLSRDDVTKISNIDFVYYNSTAMPAGVKNSEMSKTVRKYTAIEYEITNDDFRVSKYDDTTKLCECGNIVNPYNLENSEDIAYNDLCIDCLMKVLDDTLMIPVANKTRDISSVIASTVPNKFITHGMTTNSITDKVATVIAKKSNPKVLELIKELRNADNVRVQLSKIADSDGSFITQVLVEKFNLTSQAEDTLISPTTIPDLARYSNHKLAIDSLIIVLI